MLECQFLIPLKRDPEISDGDYHTSEQWEWLDDALMLNFAGRTIAPGKYEGMWPSAKTGTTISDASILYIVAVPEADVDRLRTLLKRACLLFKQQCIYLSVAGHVEFVEAETND